MTKTEKNLTSTEEAQLDDFFAAARAARPAPGPDLMARILADAEAASPARRPGLLERLKAMIEPVGGLAGVMGLAACALFGISLGYTGTGGVDTLLETVTPGGFDLDSAVSVFDVGGLAFDELEG